MKRLFVPLYGLRIFMSNNEADCRKYIAKHGGDVTDCDKAMGCCPVWQDKKNEHHRIMAVFRGGPGVVAHEASHMAWVILSTCGIAVDADNNEPMAFLVDWLVKTFHKSFQVPPK